ncbi:hypothetical protein NM208_g4269 [Fusarium decemcellulare]|uniref:Uncharacterized protein n=1 Tax=Fusarium decemcellulare TaxID=57161 RepID=A0ACC1SLG4_9HYPO|nr:hypothetical protein NM208_g4269 [Fusarium decemcellulare]
MAELAVSIPEVTCIHAYPGIAATNLMDKVWGSGNHRLIHALVRVGRPLMRRASISTDESGERSVYLITSVQFGGKGVPLVDGIDGGLTVHGLKRGGLFLLQPVDVLQKLKATSADNAVWEHAQQVLQKYL